jgi:hypothetical protein
VATLAGFAMQRREYLPARCSIGSQLIDLA